MSPSITVLQLDTDFPRVPGDVGCPQTYLDPVEIIRIPGASVGGIVSAAPQAIAIAPFEDAVFKARGDIVVTSCGFLSYWQDHLARFTNKPFLSSSLTALPMLCDMLDPSQILTVTFDAESLNESHYGIHRTQVVGLSSKMHLRQVISKNLPSLDAQRAGTEIVDHIIAHLQPHHEHILLECTNLPPYKQALHTRTRKPITDILTCIEALRPGSVRPDYLSGMLT